jgi:hypothetical protein
MTAINAIHKVQIFVHLLLHIFLLLCNDYYVVWWVDTNVLKDCAASKMLVSTHHTTWCNNPGNHELYLHHCENLSYFHINLDIPDSRGSVITTIKMKEEYTFHTNAMLFYILQKCNINKSCIFYEDLLPHKVSGPCIN